MFQKLAPMKVETTMLAFAATIINLAYGVVGKFMGIFINLFVGVTKDDLSKYWILKVINVISYLPY